ncbi:MAG: hypothetical protein WC584_00160 [Candidatus Pacearchaeota archaeon]
MKIQKLKIFTLPHGKQEILEEIRIFLPLMENKKNRKVFHLSKSRRFEDKKFSVPFKIGNFEDKHRRCSR